MKSKGLFKGIGLALMGTLISLSVKASDTTEVTDTEVAEPAIVGNVEMGRQYFEGSKGFINGGPACITCHNVTNDKLIPGGVLAKDLTSVYERLGEGMSGMIETPPFPAMSTSYKNHPVRGDEATHIIAFLKHANEVKDTQKASSGSLYLILGGGGGLIAMLILISILWMKRKKQMVKREIFARQNKAWDAKH